MTPGVYVEEINAFPGSAVAVETAVPIFIGYTQKADRKGKSLKMVPTRVTSFAEYVEMFGQGFSPKFTLTPVGGSAKPQQAPAAQPTLIDGATPGATNAGADADASKSQQSSPPPPITEAAPGGAPEGTTAPSPGAEVTGENAAAKATPGTEGGAVAAGAETTGDAAKSGQQPTPQPTQNTAATPQGAPVLTAPATPDAGLTLGNATRGVLAGTEIGAVAINAGPTFILNNTEYTLEANNTLYFYSCIRMFYQNGGSKCYILSVGTYGDAPDGVAVQKSDFIGDDPNKDIFKILEKEFEPTLVVIPDIISKVDDAYMLYQQVLMHCAKTQSRFGIFDVMQSGDTADADIKKFRTDIGTTALNYGAAYYPWLNTAVISSSELDFNNLAPSVNLSTLLPENKEKIKEVIQQKAELQAKHDGKTNATAEWLKADQKSIDTNFHQSLLAASPTYRQLMEEIRSRLNLLPPSSAMAGIYTLIDSTRGVWKAPANVSIAMVNGPSVNISHEQQEQMNVDVTAGKSINVIRPFPGIGTLVWGARTLDGNSQDWRYINVRRTMIMIEQSLKLATRAYVFEPNDSGTWVTLRSMINNFLFNLWKLGALAGSAPEQAYDVQVGLGKTMTPTDILDGILRVSVKVAVVRPAEFIVITFQQLQQQA